MDIKLTPAEDLVLNVLAARWRVGEHLWTFDSNQKRWLDSLADKGLVNVMHGMVENTVRASLTEKGKQEYFNGNVPACGDTGKAAPDSLHNLVPRDWLWSKKRRKRKIAEAIHERMV